MVTSMGAAARSDRRSPICSDPLRAEHGTQNDKELKAGWSACLTDQLPAGEPDTAARSTPGMHCPASICTRNEAPQIQLLRYQSQGSHLMDSTTHWLALSSAT